jgi:phosphatidylinositol alpha-mannosyltransferase
MRICLVSSAYRPYISGVGEHVHYLGTHLQKMGHNVHVLTSTCHTLANSEQLPATRLGKGLILPFADGQFTLPIGVNLFWQVKKFFQKFRFDIVHCHGIFPPELAFWAALYSDCPLIVTFHTVTPNLPDAICWLFSLFFKKLNSKLRSRIAVSYATKAWAEKLFPGNYEVIPNGVDLSRFHPNVKPSLPPSPFPRLLYVGRLEKRKGLEFLLRALPEVRKEFPAANLTVVGYGPLKDYFINLTVKLNIREAVDFVGPVANTNLAGYYTAAQVYIAPTVGREAMGIVLLEAMACGIPVIASDTSGYNEVIKNGESGILVPPGDVGKLAEAIITVLGSQPLREKLIENELIRAKEFGWDRITAQIVEIYKLNLKS